MAKGRPKGRLQRPRPSRQPYDRVLVVCEGAKTEPIYLNELLNHYKLSTANIEVLGTGIDPMSLVATAKRRARGELRQGEKFDRVYCVFDRNSHANFPQASQNAIQSGMRLARSWPCFEFWLLLHFRYTRSPYAPTGGRSASENCVVDLRKALPEYSKGGGGIFLQLLPRLDGAKANAIKAKEDAQTAGGNNPSTEFHELVEYLQSLVVKQRRITFHP